MLKMTVVEIISRGEQAVLQLRDVNFYQSAGGLEGKDRIRELDCAPIKSVDVWREWPSKHADLGKEVIRGAGFGLQPLDEPLRQAIGYWRKKQDRKKRFEAALPEQLADLVGTLVKKCSGKPFKNGEKVAKVTGVVESPWGLRLPAFTFEGFEGSVDARFCMPADEEGTDE